MSFNNLKAAVQQRFNRLKTHNLYAMATGSERVVRVKFEYRV